MKKILIVDDDMDLVQLVKNRLEKNNYEVIYSTDGEDGFRKAVEHLPDLVIMDVMMPKVSGGEAVKLLKTNETTRFLPILFFTVLATNSANDSESDEINVGGRLYPAITKPFEPSKLLAAIKKLLGE